MFFDKSKWKLAVKQIAPMIWESLGTELETSALKTISSELQIEKLTLEEFRSIVESGLDDSQMSALKNANDKFADMLKANNIKLGEKKCWHFNVSFLDIMQHVLAIGITYGFFILLFGIADGTYNLKDSEALTILVGSLTTAWLTIIGYIYGTSISSRLKDKSTQKQE